MDVRFELCPASKVDALMTFIDRHWKKDHVFVKNRALFDWQHRNEEGGYNFVLATLDDEIVGVLGFIPTWQFSTALKPARQLWLAIWKVRDDIGLPGLGITLLTYLRRELRAETICSLGLSQQVVPIYRALKYQVGQLDHYVFFHQRRTSFQLVQPPDDYHVDCTVNDLVCSRVSDVSMLKGRESLFRSKPYKDANYMRSRYLAHPVYAYEMVLIEGTAAPTLLLVFRILRVNGASIGRIVDVQGGSILDKRYNTIVSRLIEAHDLDYMDVLCNLEPTDAASGFKSCRTGSTVVPNYFEPFDKRRIVIDYAYQTDGDPLVIYRGDSDQDRPNL